VKKGEGHAKVSIHFKIKVSIILFFFWPERGEGQAKASVQLKIIFSIFQFLTLNRHGKARKEGNRLVEAGYIQIITVKINTLLRKTSDVNLLDGKNTSQ